MRLACFVISSLIVFSCAHSPEPAESSSSKNTASDKSASAASTLGDPIPAEVTPIPVSSVVANSAEWSGKTLALEGVVTKMCKKKGCWFEVTDGSGGPGVLITATRYHIFLAQGSEGKSIVAYGEFKREVQDLDEAKHLAQDAGEPEPTEAPVIMRLVASGVRFR